jgi:hypothetical protein
MLACGPYGPRGFESLSRRQFMRSTKTDIDKESEMKHVQVATILVLVVLATSLAPRLVYGAPTLQTSLSLYTSRDKQVSLIGSGFGSQDHYVWVQTPNENRTHFSGKIFTPVAGGMIPPSVSLPISADDPLGTYLVSISTSAEVDDQQAIAHFGLWGTTKPLYQRTQSVKIWGGGLFPGTGLKLSIRNPAGDYVHTATLASNAEGNFNYTWRISEDAVTETYKILIDGTGTFDNPQQDYVCESRFTVTQAIFSVQIVAEPSPSYQRTETAKVSFTLAYPDGSPVLKSKPGIRPIILLQNQSTAGYATITLTDTANGIWTAESKISVNATPSARYRFNLPAMSFDDGFGNGGGAADAFSSYFQVRNASLIFTSEVNGTQIQIPFGQVSIISRITYPDGTSLFNGTARVQVFTGSSTSDIKLTYDPTIKGWRASYSSAFSDLWRIGAWRLQVEAHDTFGNSGTATYEVTAQPYLFIALIAVVIALALFGRWTVSRYGRKVYFRIRKIVMRFRGHRTLESSTEISHP